PSPTRGARGGGWGAAAPAGRPSQQIRIPTPRPQRSRAPASGRRVDIYRCSVPGRAGGRPGRLTSATGHTVWIGRLSSGTWQRPRELRGVRILRVRANPGRDGSGKWRSVEILLDNGKLISTISTTRNQVEEAG